MTRLHIRPNDFDRLAARVLGNKTSRVSEYLSEALTRMGDERFLLPAVGIIALASVISDSPKKRDFERLLAVLIVTSCIDHLSKDAFVQIRPDRVPANRRRAVPKSGSGKDAFPSGHAMHLGALASALQRMYPQSGMLIWSAAALVCTTRVVLLAHWASDVLVGLGVGVATDRLAPR